MAEFDKQDLKELGEKLASAIGDASKLSPDQRRQKTEAFALSKEGARLTKLSNAQIKQLVSGNTDLNKHTKDYIEALQKVNNRLDELGSTIKDTANFTVGFGKALGRGEGTISSITDTLSGRFGLFGDAVAGAGQLLDNNIEVFRQLAQTGASFGQSIVQLRQQAAAAALPLDDFAQLVGNNSEALAALAGSSTRGAQFISGLNNALRTQAVPQLATLGFTIEEINDTLLLNLERQRRTGVFDQNATQANIDSSIRFAKELDRLAKLTGLQRDQLRNAIDSAQSNERFQASLLNVNKDVRQELDLFAGTIEGLSPELATGIQDLIANAGVPVTQAAEDIFLNVPQLGPIVQQLRAGTLTAQEALVQTGKLFNQSGARFQEITVTGLAGFTSLQGSIINVGNRLMDLDAVLAEQGQAGDELTTGLTQFEDASKRASAAVQSLETGFLSAVGSFIGDSASGVNSGLTGLSKAVLGLPVGIQASLFGISKLLQGGLALLKDTAPTFAAVYGGTLAANQKLGIGKMLSMAGGTFKGTFGGGPAGLGGKLLRGTGAVGAGIGAVGAVKGLLDDDPSNNLASILTLVGTGAGALLGGPVGAALGGMAGGAAGSFFEGRQFGGGMDGGQSYLVGEAGPEMVVPGTKSSVVANNDLKSTFDTEALEAKMSNMVSELNAANKTLSDMVNGVNTLVAIEGRSLKAVESTSRKVGGQVGLV